MGNQESKQATEWCSILASSSSSGEECRIAFGKIIKAIDTEVDPTKNIAQYLVGDPQNAKTLVTALRDKCKEHQKTEHLTAIAGVIAKIVEKFSSQTKWMQNLTSVQDSNKNFVLADTLINCFNYDWYGNLTSGSMRTLGNSCDLYVHLLNIIQHLLKNQSSNKALLPGSPVAPFLAKSIIAALQERCPSGDLVAEFCDALSNLLLAADDRSRTSIYTDCTSSLQPVQEFLRTFGDDATIFAFRSVLDKVDHRHCADSLSKCILTVCKCNAEFTQKLIKEDSTFLQDFLGLETLLEKDPKGIPVVVDGLRTKLQHKRVGLLLQKLKVATADDSSSSKLADESSSAAVVKSVRNTLFEMNFKATTQPSSRPCFVGPEALEILFGSLQHPAVSKNEENLQLLAGVIGSTAPKVDLGLTAIVLTPAFLPGLMKFVEALEDNDDTSLISELITVERIGVIFAAISDFEHQEVCAEIVSLLKSKIPVFVKILSEKAKSLESAVSYIATIRNIIMADVLKSKEGEKVVIVGGFDGKMLAEAVVSTLKEFSSKSAALEGNLMDIIGTITKCEDEAPTSKSSSVADFRKVFLDRNDEVMAELQKPVARVRE